MSLEAVIDVKVFVPRIAREAIVSMNTIGQCYILLLSYVTVIIYIFLVRPVLFKYDIIDYVLKSFPSARIFFIISYVGMFLIPGHIFSLILLNIAHEARACFTVNGTPQHLGCVSFIRCT